MPLHHLLPHASTVAVILSSALAGVALYSAMRRDRFAAGIRSLIGRCEDTARGGLNASASFGCGRTGNASFDDYREQTLKKLEDEAAEFRAYLNNLRSASDRAEFEEFLKSRRERGASQN